MKIRKGFTKGKARKPALEMNKTEQAYWDKVIVPAQQAGRIDKAVYERLKVVLAPGSTYTPDFFLTTEDGDLIVVEIKGFWREDDRVKIKVAADTFSSFYWYAVTMTTTKVKKVEGFGGSDTGKFPWLFQFS